MSKQPVRMLFQQGALFGSAASNLFSGAGSNLPNRASAVVGTLFLSRRAKTGFGGETLAKARDNVRSGTSGLRGGPEILVSAGSHGVTVGIFRLCGFAFGYLLCLASIL